MRALLLPFLLAFATPATAQMPTYTTPAPFAYMKDVTSGLVLYSKGADTPIPPASMGKMMTVYVAFDLIKRREATLNQTITVRPETWTKWHSQGSTMFLSVNEQVSVDNLLHGIVTLSGNDACVVLAEGLGGTEANYVALMNRAAQRMGLTGSRFANTSGWPDPNEMVTPRDLAVIAERTIKDFPDLYKRYYGTKDFTWGKTLGKGDAIVQPNRNPLLGRVSGADGLKTGHTEEAGYGFTGSAEQNGRRLVMVVAGLSSFNERIAASVDFMNWGFAAWQQVPVLRAGAVAGRAKVIGGKVEDVAMTAITDLQVVAPRGFGTDRKVRAISLPVLNAPIAKGQRVGWLVVSIKGLPDQRQPLVAGEAVEEGNWFQKLWAKIAG